METINLDEFFIYCIPYNNTDVRIDVCDVQTALVRHGNPEYFCMTVEFIPDISHKQGLYKNSHLQVLEQTEIKTKEDAKKAFETIQLIFQVAKQRNHEGIVIPFAPVASVKEYAALYNKIRVQANGMMRVLCFAAPIEYIDILSHALYQL
jgi:hypothetical protein